MKILKLSLSILFAISMQSCWWMHDSVTLQIQNSSSLDTTINSDHMEIVSVLLLPGQTVQYQKTFYDHNCIVDFSCQNSSFTESHTWTPYFETWPSDWTLTIEITDAGVSFGGDFPSEWR